MKFFQSKKKTSKKFACVWFLLKHVFLVVILILPQNSYDLRQCGTTQWFEIYPNPSHQSHSDHQTTSSFFDPWEEYYDRQIETVEIHSIDNREIEIGHEHYDNNNETGNAGHVNRFSYSNDHESHSEQEIHHGHSDEAVNQPESQSKVHDGQESRDIHVDDSIEQPTESHIDSSAKHVHPNISHPDYHHQSHEQSHHHQTHDHSTNHTHTSSSSKSHSPPHEPEPSPALQPTTNVSDHSQESSLNQTEEVGNFAIQ